MERKLQKRNAKIIEWHSEGYTQQAIADELGLTRQRVQQLERVLHLKREPKLGRSNHTCKCKQCKKKFDSPSTTRLFCSRECFYQSRKLILSKKDMATYIEQKKALAREKASLYYYNVLKKRPDFHEVVRQRNMKYAPSTINK